MKYPLLSLYQFYCCNINLSYIQVNLSMEKSNMSIDEIKETSKKCAMYRADYFECLHGDKRVARAKVLAKAQEASEGHGH